MVREISTCTDRTDLSLSSSHVGRKLFWRKTCANYVIWVHRKKRASVPPCQNRPPHLWFSSCTVGVTQKPKCERVMEVLVHMLMLAGPLAEFFFPSSLAALPCLSLWTCGVWNTFQADMGYYNRSSECCAGGDECVGARVCVCVKWNPSLAKPHLAT